MKLKKRSCYAAIILAGVLSLTGCSNGSGSHEETPYYLISIDGVRQYRSENDESVQQLKELGLGYVNLTAKVDYQSTDNANEELEYFCDELRADYEEYGYIDSAVETVKYYEQVQEVLESSIAEIQFFELYDEEMAWVAVDYMSMIKHATDEYFEIMEIKPNTKYKRTMTLGFIRENGEWKVSQYDITDRVEVK